MSPVERLVTTPVTTYVPYIGDEDAIELFCCLSAAHTKLADTEFRSVVPGRLTRRYFIPLRDRECLIRGLRLFQKNIADRGDH